MLNFFQEVQAKALTAYVNSPLFLADGDNTKNYAMRIVFAIGGVIIGAGGAWLIVVGAKDIIMALSGDNKDVKKAGVGIGVGVVGGGMVLLGVTGIKSLFSGLGNDFSSIS